MALRTLCLSTETSSQDESEGSNVYLPTDGLIKDAMMSENRKNPVVNLLDVNGGRKQFLVRSCKPTHNIALQCSVCSARLSQFSIWQAE